MAPAILSTDSVKSHIPAWKRLGLKLRSAQPVSIPYASPVVFAPIGTELKREKRKRETPDEGPLHGKRINKSAKAHKQTVDTTPNKSPIISSLKRRKSVAFTPETKTEDGDSIKQLYNEWVSKHQTNSQDIQELRSKSTSNSSGPLQYAEQIDSAIDAVLKGVEAVKKPKREKRAKNSKLASSHKVARPAGQLDPAVLYLRLFHEAKDTWKFNKIHQVNLLKNAFDVDRIPSEYIEIFYKYIAGLKGLARTKLRDAAIAVKMKDKEVEVEASKNMDNNAANQGLKSNCEKNVISTVLETTDEERALQPLRDLTIKKRMAKRMRAERILVELAHDVQGSGEEVNCSSESVKEEEGDRGSQKRLKMSDGSTRKVRRRRKQRTNAVEDTSSSESTDSESSSEDELDDKPEQADEESTSSSSSSSSTSHEDEDTEGLDSESENNESE